MKTRRSLFTVASLIVLQTALLAPFSHLYAESYPNQVTFDNRSGNYALVKLVGPSGGTIEVPNNNARTVNVAPGTYVILVRYGDDPRSFTYSKGQAFSVEQIGNLYSVITITLHPVIGGNYETRPISAAEFNGQ